MDRLGKSTALTAESLKSTQDDLYSFKKKIGFQVLQNYDQNKGKIMTLQTDTKDNRSSISSLQHFQEAFV